MKVRRNRTQAIMDAVGKMKNPAHLTVSLFPSMQTRYGRWCLPCVKLIFHVILITFIQRELRTENNA